MSDPHHPVIDNAWEWSVVGRSYYAAGEVEAEATLDLRLRRRGEVRHLRFLGVQDLAVRKGFPQVGWLLINDIRKRGLEGLGVLVHDGERSEAIHFYARAVNAMPAAA